MGLMARLGIGGASVDTVLDSATTAPGGAVTGTVHLKGGSADQQIREIRVSLEATVEVESGDNEWRENVRFGTQVVGGDFTIPAGQARSDRFSFGIPWQCPVTVIGGWQSRGLKVGVRTKVDIPGAVDPGDLDAIAVVPLPVQQAVLDALTSLGFRFRGADVEKGRLPGSDLPFYQEVEFTPPSTLRGKVSELEVTFLADAGGVEVVLEADRRGGIFSEGRDATSRVRLGHHDTDVRSVAGLLDGQVRQLGARRGWF